MLQCNEWHEQCECIEGRFCTHFDMYHGMHMVSTDSTAYNFNVHVCSGTRRAWSQLSGCPAAPVKGGMHCDLVRCKMQNVVRVGMVGR